MDWSSIIIRNLLLKTAQKHMEVCYMAHPLASVGKIVQFMLPVSRLISPCLRRLVYYILFRNKVPISSALSQKYDPVQKWLLVFLSDQSIKPPVFELSTPLFGDLLSIIISILIGTTLVHPFKITTINCTFRGHPCCCHMEEATIRACTATAYGRSGRRVSACRKAPMGSGVQTARRCTYGPGRSPSLKIFKQNESPW